MELKFIDERKNALQHTRIKHCAAIAELRFNPVLSIPVQCEPPVP